MLKSEDKTETTFAQRLKAARKNIHRTGKDVAELAGINYQTYMSYEKGVSLPSAENLVKIANVLGVSTDYLLQGKLKDDTNTYDKSRFDLLAIMKKRQNATAENTSSKGFNILDLLYPYPEDKEQRDIIGTDIAPEVNRLKAKLLDKNASFGSIPINAKTRQTFFIRFNQLVNELLFQNYFTDDKEKATGGNNSENEPPVSSEENSKSE